MRISITIVASDTAVSNDFIPLEVFPDMSLDDVKGFVEAEINVPPSAQKYIIKDQIVTDTSRKLTDLGINDDDILSLAIQTRLNATPATNPAQQTQRSRQQTQPDTPDPESLRLQALGDPRIRAELQRVDQSLADALNDPARFRARLEQRAQEDVQARREKEELYARLQSDPFDIEAQKKIEEIIRQERVAENYYKAYELNPESFGRVNMLYIDVLVNNVPIKAFVDSGAQSTIMSPSAAQRCGIMRLIDTRFSGIAKGVGTAKILGRVHHAEMQIGQYSLESSFTVMEGKDVDLLLGLDMLKRHQMCIDLKDNVLRIASDKVPFLGESEIPKMLEESLEDEPKVEGPDGGTIGAKTGVYEPASGSTAQVAESSTSTSTQPAPGPRITIHPTGSTGNIETSRPPNPTPITASNPPNQTPVTPVGSFGAPAAITEQSIAQVMELGFSRAEAVTALEQAGGNVELAIGLLL